MKKRGLRVLTLFLAILLSFTFMPSTRVWAQTEEERLEEAQKKLKELEEEKKKIEEQKKNAKNELADLNYQKTSVKEQLDELTLALECAAAELDKLEKAIMAKEEELVETGQELELARQKEDAQYAQMKERMQYLYENEGNSYLDMLLEVNNFGEFLNLTEYMNMLAKYDNRMLDEYQASRKATEEAELALEAEKTELEVLKQETVNEKTRIDGLIEETAQKLEYYSNQVSDAKKELADIEKEAKDNQADIEQIKREIELSKRSRNSKKRDVSEIVYDENDRYLLANLIYCEAGGEPYEGQVAVGAVVINRVRSSVFPDTVYSVIYQKKQFAPVADGHLALALAQNRATESCYRAADEAMAGYSNVGDCVFFRTVIPGIEGIIIGNHIFY